MTVFQMLAEVVGAVKFLRLVAFLELVDIGQMLDTTIPVWLRKIGKFFTTIATSVGGRTVGALRRGRGRRMKSRIVVGESSAGPGMAPQVE